MTKLDKLVERSPHYSIKEDGIIDGSVVSRIYSLDDRKLISFRNGAREMTEEQRASYAERMRQLRQKQMSGAP